MSVGADVRMHPLTHVRSTAMLLKPKVIFRVGEIRLCT